jgi:RsiW-degrading membrane proteinase PrsW (M82 family)
MEAVLVLVVLIAFTFILLRGFIRVFSDNFWLALLMLILLPPLFLLWIFVEGVLSKPTKGNHD